jgi:hypothetical protein
LFKSKEKKTTEKKTVISLALMEGNAAHDEQQENGMQKITNQSLLNKQKKLKLIFEIVIAIEFLIFVQIRILC